MDQALLIALMGGSAANAGAVSPSAFAFQAETTTLATALTTPPSAARKSTYDRAIKRLKATGLFAKGRWLSIVGADEDASLTNWIAPAEKATKTGTPTFLANNYWQATAITQYLATPVFINTLSQNNVSMFMWSDDNTGSLNADAGAVVTGVGMSLAGRTPSGTETNGVLLRACSNTDQLSVPSGGSDGCGLTGWSRNNSANFTTYRNGVQKITRAVASSALPAVAMWMLALNNNGSPSASFSPRKLSALWIGQALNETEARNLTGIIGEYMESIQHGEPIIQEVGIGSASITADCIAYGFNAGSIAWCLQAARQGKNVALVGGWRDRWTFGGMSGGGLGFTDFDNHASLGGLPRYVITRMNALAGVADTQFYFECKRFNWVMRELLNPALNGGFTIPVYQTNGVVSVAKTGARINSFATTDGRTFTGLQYFDGSYEGDLMRRAGVGYILGREAAGSGAEANNGVLLSTTNQLYQPWVTADTPASGLIPNIQGVRTTFGGAADTVGANGTADAKTQAYNFRLTLTTNALNTFRHVPLPSTPPAGHVDGNYEFLYRYLAGNAAIDTLGEILKIDALNAEESVRHDANNSGFVSTDYVGMSHTYPLASYAQREVIWKATWNYIMGFIYTLQYSADSRVVAGMKTDALKYGFAADHYFAPHENDNVFDMPAMYVRESIRMVSNAIMAGTDLTNTDGTTPRISTNTIATISYAMDSHAIQRVAYEASAGNWQTRSEGGLGATGGGVDQTTPVPYEIVVPKASECTNLAVGFCISATHIAFGSIRMEYTAMQIGQSMGLAAALAIAGDGIIQNVTYSTLRTALLASASLSGEVAPVLPQVN